ncbi:hypothetical protein DOY81_006080 [Sarcophaga bullata]|nr:hypothetical protein DOY81_006080 [Sarcophaga bullata]
MLLYWFIVPFCKLFDCIIKASVCFTTGLQLTNREILLSAIRVAQNLENFTMEEGEIVGICAANTDYLTSLVFGCFFNGLAISTLDPSFNKGE